MNIQLIISSIELGAIYSLVTLAVWFATTIISFEDLSVEGTFVLGGALTTYSILSLKLPAIIALIFAFCGGAFAGAATGILHTFLGLSQMLSGIVVATALFSFNLALCSAQAMLPLDQLLFAVVPAKMAYALLLPICVGIYVVISWLLTTEIGFVLRAIGRNASVIEALGKDTRLFKIGALALTNGLTALAGALLVQYVGYFSIWSGIGTLVIALASLMISKIIGKQPYYLIAGSLLYQFLIAITLELRMAPEWNKAISAAIIIMLVGAHQFMKGSHA